MNNKKALIIGGTTGIGFSISRVLSAQGFSEIYIVGRNKPLELVSNNVKWIKFDLMSDDYSLLKKYIDVDLVVFSAGYGELKEFRDINEDEIDRSFIINSIAPIKIIKMFYDRINSKDDFYISVITSISGLVSSPLFSVYSSTKASLCRFIESVNIELEVSGSENKILNVAPGYIEGTGFESRTNSDSSKTLELAFQIIESMYKKEELFIPMFKSKYKDVILRYNNNPKEFGLSSYNYKIKSGRLKR